MVRAVELHRLTHMRLPLPPCPMRRVRRVKCITSFARSQPRRVSAFTTISYRFGQLLCRQRRAQVPTLLLVGFQRLGLDLPRNLPIRGFSPFPMCEPVVVRLCHTRDEASDMPGVSPKRGPPSPPSASSPSSGESRALAGVPSHSS